MQGDPHTRLGHNLMHLLRPQQAGIAARAAGTWLRSSFPTPAAERIDDSTSLGRIGALEVRLARDKREVKRAQKLRYKVFYKDGTAIADAATMLAQRDKDAFDKFCDHLLVLDHAAKPSLS